MRRAASFALVALVVVGSSGCGLGRLWPWGKKRDGRPEPLTPEERGALGLPKPLEDRFKQETLEDVAAETSRTRKGLRLVIATDKATYTMDEPIVLDLRVENRSGLSGEAGDTPRDIPVYFEPLAKSAQGRIGEWHFKFHIRSEETGRAIYESRRFEVPEADRADYYHFMVLPQHAYVGRQFPLPRARARGWLRPGRYTIAVTYEVDDDFPYVILNRHFTAKQVELLGTKLAYTRVWTGRLYSNRVSFRIRRKRRWWWPF